MPYWVYILASKRNGTLYVGLTNDLARRVWQHRTGVGAVFTRKYGVTRLVYAQPYADVSVALAEERTLKRWRRAWKLALIEQDNPQWRDLYDDLNR